MAKKKMRFNVVDVLIILLVAAALAVFGYVFLSEKNVAPSGEKVKIQYVLQVSEIRDMLVGNVEKGDEVYEADTDKYLGKVTAVSSMTSTRTGTNRATGAQVVSEVEGRSDLYITIENTADLIDNKYLVDGISVVVGGVVNMIAPNLLSPANIVNVEIVE